MPSPARTKRKLSAATPATSARLVPRPALPHERDETTHALPPVQPEMAQARRDVDRGLVDTDCYSKLGKLVERGRKP
jgi:hypothetical protein